MTFQVIVHAFGAPVIREVEVPVGVYSGDGLFAVRDLLDLIFQYGQNDFQSRKCPSVSVGDFIIVKDEVYEVADFGFNKLNKV
jgi:hypothetical protein